MTDDHSVEVTTALSPGLEAQDQSSDVLAGRQAEEKPPFGFDTSICFDLRFKPERPSNDHSRVNFCEFDVMAQSHSR